MSEVATLVKFGSHEHILQLQQTGLLYLNNLPYFWKIEDQELRGDRYDGVDNIHGVLRQDREPRMEKRP